MLRDVHDRHTRDFSYSPFEILVTRGNNVTFMLKRNTKRIVQKHTYIYALNCFYIYGEHIPTCDTLWTRQSSAYVPWCIQGNLSNRGSLIILKATLYFWPNFSNSAMTQSVMYGIPVTRMLWVSYQLDT